MEFELIHSLAQRGPVNSLPDEQLDFPIFKGDLIVSFESDHSEFGYDLIRVFLAYYKDQWGLLIVKNWCSVGPYSAEGTQEEFYSLTEGIKFLSLNGVGLFKTIQYLAKNIPSPPST